MVAKTPFFDRLTLKEADEKLEYKICRDYATNYVRMEVDDNGEPKAGENKPLNPPEPVTYELAEDAKQTYHYYETWQKESLETGECAPENSPIDDARGRFVVMSNLCTDGLDEGLFFEADRCETIAEAKDLIKWHKLADETILDWQALIYEQAEKNELEPMCILMLDDCNPHSLEEKVDALYGAKAEFTDFSLPDVPEALALYTNGAPAKKK